MTVEYLQQIAEDPKKWLGRNYRAEMRIKAKRDRIAHLHEICNTTTQELKPVVVYTGPSNKIEKCITEAIDLESEIRVEIFELEKIQRETAEAIRLLLDDVILVELMELRYLTDKRWEEIAVDMSYAYRWVQRLHSRALRLMKQKAAQLIEQAALSADET